MSRSLLALASLLAVGAAACSSDDTAASTADGVRTVEVDVVDNRFEPGSLVVEEGETVRFVLTSSGELTHDAFVGDAEAQADHEADMRADDDGHDGGHGDDEAAVTIEPGETVELTHTFDEAGPVELACHQPGHYEAGMILQIDVR